MYPNEIHEAAIHQGRLVRLFVSIATILSYKITVKYVLYALTSLSQRPLNVDDICRVYLSFTFRLFQYLRKSRLYAIRLRADNSLPQLLA